MKSRISSRASERRCAPDAGPQAAHAAPTAAPESSGTCMRFTAASSVSRALALAVFSATAFAQVTERISLDSTGAEVPGGGDLPSPDHVISPDGRFVLFFSGASALIPGDTNGTWDVFLHDRLNGNTERVSIGSNGAQANGRSGLYGFSMSPDARFVVFESLASNLVTPDLNGSEVFMRDRVTDSTERVAIDSAGVQGNGLSSYPSVSADGRFVAFTSNSSNLVPGDTNGKWDVFVHDRVSGATDRISLSTAGAQGNADSYRPVMASDGRFVAFESLASNLVASDTNNHWDVFVRDLQAGNTELVSSSIAGTSGHGDSWLASLSDDGHYVGFTSWASDLVSGDLNGFMDVFRRDRWSGATTLVSVNLAGVSGNWTSSGVMLSADGRWAAFTSAASDLIANSPVGLALIFERDMQSGTTELVSRATDGTIPGTGGCKAAFISTDGRYVGFASNMPTLVPNDTNDSYDVFLHDRLSAGFTSLCDPGVGNVLACPCGNPPSGTGRGCDNSSSTGGAALAATGIAYLSIDSLAFTTHDEKPSALSILLQGTSLDANGTAFGQGVRCAGGSLKRLFAKTAVQGSITAPDLASGDPTISARSAALGVPIQPGQPCAYLVYYRDPIVFGGCATTQTFNCTQTGTVTFWP